MPRPACPRLTAPTVHSPFIVEGLDGIDARGDWEDVMSLRSLAGYSIAALAGAAIARAHAEPGVSLHSFRTILATACRIGANRKGLVPLGALRLWLRLARRLSLGAGLRLSQLLDQSLGKTGLQVVRR